MKFLNKFMVALVVVVVATVAACTPTGNVVSEPDNPDNNLPKNNVTNPPDNGDSQVNLSEEDETILQAVHTAREWTQENSSTFVYDGRSLAFKSLEKAECAGCWNVTLTFTSTSGGYGDRTGRTVTQVLTDHEIEIGLKQRKVNSAVTDNTFNEITKRMISVPTPPAEEPEEFTREKAIKTADKWMREEAGTFVTRGSNLIVRSAYPATCQGCWTVVFSFDVNRRGYGFDDKRAGNSYDSLDERRTVVRVEKGEVVQALTDGQFDEIVQKFVREIDNNLEDEDDIIEIAEDWINDDSETFKYDGRGLELDDVDKKDCDNLENIEGHNLDEDDIDDLDDCWRVIFDFTSRYEGYGDRTGDDPDREDTNHEIEIWIADEDVVSAITDGRYDEIRQELI